MLVTAAESVALLQGAAEHNVVSQVPTGVIMDELGWRTAPRREPTLRQALASGLVATPFNAVWQALDNVRAETLEAAKRAVVKTR